ncbi:MAG: PaaI family thioesterase [Ardenticatenaceae bacterium]
MSKFEPRNPNFETDVRASFAKQKVMTTIGASLTRVSPGEVEIELPFRDDLTQQHGFLHAGIVTTIVDNACGYAALSLMPADAEVLTIEYKVNFLSPAIGERMIARARVSKAGRTITVCAGDVFALDDGDNEGQEKLVATMLATMMTIMKRKTNQ